MAFCERTLCRDNWWNKIQQTSAHYLSNPIPIRTGFLSFTVQPIPRDHMCVVQSARVNSSFLSMKCIECGGKVKRVVESTKSANDTYFAQSKHDWLISRVIRLGDRSEKCKLHMTWQQEWSETHKLIVPVIEVTHHTHVQWLVSHESYLRIVYAQWNIFFETDGSKTRTNEPSTITSGNQQRFAGYFVSVSDKTPVRAAFSKRRVHAGYN